MTEQEMTNKVRQVIKHTDDEDVEVKMISLCKDDVFTLKEPDGKLVGKYKCDENAYINEHGIATVMCDLMDKKL